MTAWWEEGLNVDAMDFNGALVFRIRVQWEEFHWIGDNTSDTKIIKLDGAPAVYYPEIKTTELIVDGRVWLPRTPVSEPVGTYRYEWVPDTYGVYNGIKPSVPIGSDYNDKWPNGAYCAFRYIPAER